MIEKRFGATGRVSTFQLNGRNLEGRKDNSFDCVAAYSVLHHIPDYMAAVEEIWRVTKPGGVMYFDHEGCEDYWTQTENRKIYDEFLQKIRPDQTRREKVLKYFKPWNYYYRIRKSLNPRWESQGDIHVWPDDHIECAKIEQFLVERGGEVVCKEDYLVFKRGYPQKTFDEYSKHCHDVTALAIRK
jgi:SAM-dependent methyltransferase